MKVIWIKEDMKLKFGGVSIGGISPEVKIYGKKYILKFGLIKKI